MGVSPTEVRASHGVAADPTDARADGGAAHRGRAAAAERRAHPGRDRQGGGRQPRLGDALEALAAAGLAADKKGARRTGRAIAFLDETGHTFRSLVGTTWAPRGRPPVLKRVSQRREVSSVVALVAPLDGPARLYARHFCGSIHG